MIRQTIKNAILHSVVFCTTVLIFWIWYAAITNVWTNTSTLEVSSWSILSADSWNKLLGNFEFLNAKTENVYNVLGRIWIGEQNPIRALHLSWNSDIELILEQKAAKANFKKWNLVAAWWNSTTEADFFIRQLNDLWNSWITTFFIKWNWWNVWIWTSTPSYKLHVNWTAWWTSWTNTSDQRYKKDVKTLTWVLDKIDNLRWVKFNWDKESFPEKGFTDKVNIWFIAQEVEKEFPELVNTDDDWYKWVEYANMTAVLLEAIKELKVENDKLKEKIENLENN